MTRSRRGRFVTGLSWRDGLQAGKVSVSSRLRSQPSVRATGRKVAGVDLVQFLVKRLKLGHLAVENFDVVFFHQPGAPVRLKQPPQRFGA